MKRGAISAWISTDHSVLPESDAIQERGRAVCWVPSKAGKAFRIGYTASTRECGLKVSVYIDGELAAEQTHAATKTWRRSMLRDGVRARKDSYGTERPFLFSKRSITDNDLDIISSSQLTSLGSIQVKFTWILVDRSSLSSEPCTRLCPPTEHHKPVFEGLVKRHSGAIAHAAGLGASRKIKAMVQPKWTSLKRTAMSRHRFTRSSAARNGETPRPTRWRETGLRMTTFEFKYAPAEYLDTEGILRLESPGSIPPSPNVAAVPSPWRSHVGTPYRELRTDVSFSGVTPRPIAARPFRFSDDGLNFNTPARAVKLGSHTMTNYTPLATLGSHAIVHPIKLRPLIKLDPIQRFNPLATPVKSYPLIKQEPLDEDNDVLEITASEFYRREVVDLTGLDSDDD